MDFSSGSPIAILCDCVAIFLLRPLLAIVFVLFLIGLSWFVAWKTVLVHVPLVQEICGLRKKAVQPKPHSRHRLSRFYNAAAAARGSSSATMTAMKQ